MVHIVYELFKKLLDQVRNTKRSDCVRREGHQIVPNLFVIKLTSF